MISIVRETTPILATSGTANANVEAKPSLENSKENKDMNNLGIIINLTNQHWIEWQYFYNPLGYQKRRRSMLAPIH